MQNKPHDANFTTLKLPATLALADAEVLRRDLLIAQVGQHGVQLDGAEVESVDFGSLQMLCAAFRDAAQAGAAWRWLAASAVVRTTARRLGLNAVLQLEQPEPPAKAAS